MRKSIKKYLDVDVYDAAQERLKIIFDNFDNVLVSFSGGKDSGLCLNLCYDYAVRTKQTSKLAMFHIDYEAQYKNTTEYVTKCFNSFPLITRKYWLCLPVTAPCAVSMHEPFWSPWDPAKKDLWVRDFPDSEHLVTVDNLWFEFEYGIYDYDFQEQFGVKFSEKYGSTAVIVGIRTDESLNRLRAIASGRKVNNVYDTYYLVGDEKICLAYPIYDWSVQDVFLAYIKNNWEYNKLYDLMYMAGVPLSMMRVASPFNNQAKSSLQLYKALDPDMWAKMIGRVNGVNFTGIYGKTTAMGWKSIKLPPNHTWKSYKDFLLSTLPEDTRKEYERKFAVSENFWLTKGGVLDQKTIDEIIAQGVKITVKDSTNYNSKNKPVVFLEYPDDLDVTKFQSVPSYKRMCVCIMKNDILCTYMGFSMTKEQKTKREEIMKQYTNVWGN